MAGLSTCCGGLVQVALILALVMTCVAVYTWMERKISGRIQDRLGPSRVGGRFGWLQPAADGLKLLCKEDIVPAAADGLLFRVAPYLSFCAAFVPFLALPFAPGWVVQPLDSAAFFILAIGGLEVFGVILAGYASGSKWSLYGAMREAAQVVSFEIPLGMCVVVPVLMAGTMNLTEIAQQQAGWFTSWNLDQPVRPGHLLDLYGLRHGRHEPRPLRSARGRERTGRRVHDRVFRLPLGDVLHGRVLRHVPAGPARRDPLLRRLERAGSHRDRAGPDLRTVGSRSSSARKVMPHISPLPLPASSATSSACAT